MTSTPTVSLLLKKRGIFKNNILTTLEHLENLENVTEDQLLIHRTQIEKYLSSMDAFDEQINNSYIENDTDEDIICSFNRESTLFRTGVLDSLCELKSLSNPVSFVNSRETPKVKPYKLAPKLECPKFNPKSLESDKLAFLNFQKEFMNCVADLDSDTLKLVVLKNHLVGYAFQLVQHLSISEVNFRVALDILEAEYLDKNYIVDSIFASILDGDKSLSDLPSAKKFLANFKAQIYELKNSFNLNFLEKDSPGNRLLSHVVFKKLPSPLRCELIHRIGHNYPSLEEILENYSEIARMLEFLKPEDTIPRRAMGAYKKISKHNFRGGLDSKKPSTLENFFVKPVRINFRCNFCKCNEHRAIDCSTYASLTDRLKRCKETGLCELCTSPSHVSRVCPGKDKKLNPCWKCKSCGHAGALCPAPSKSDVMSNSNTCWHIGSSNLLPIIEVSVSVGSTEKRFNFLVDSGSERSYLADGVLDMLKCRNAHMKKKNFMIKTFLGAERRCLRELKLQVNLPNSGYLVPFLVDEKLELTFHVKGLSLAVNSLIAEGAKLAANFSELENDTLPVHGLLGVDILRLMGPMRMLNYMKGTVLEFPQGIVPFGDVTDFMTPSIKALNTELCGLDYNQVITEHSRCNLTHVYFVLNPRSDYVDPLSCFEESSVERSVEKLFSLETLGVTEDAVSDYDLHKIESFRSSIRYRDNSYHVSLPWNEDKLSIVPSNHQVSLSVLHRVVSKLTKQGLYDDYCQVFLDQENEGIIERIVIDPSEFGNYTWIPHRPVVKEADQCSTKIRPVFNCSLRTGGKPSLNDCAYPGVNLYSDMLELLLTFRTDRFVLLADIRKAFLMIRLDSERDKNRFCFFMKLGNELVCFRYRTLIFGFIASPFILNYVIKYHVEKYPPSPCKEMLLSNFYVDNLIKTHNSPDALMDLYLGAVTIMSEGGFSLKTCNSNEETLAVRMKEDDNLASHGSSAEKVLGYLYVPASDELQLAPCSAGVAAVTKRGILSQNSAVFDPLGLVLPVTIRGRILLSEIWKLGLSWDAIVPSDILSIWNKLYHDLSNIGNLRFDRFVVDTSVPSSLIFFCDASKKAYGFAAYLHQNGSAKLIFSKAKVAPSSKRTLPSLELLSVYLCMKCIPCIIKAFPRDMLNTIIVAVDAQVVLSWILSDSVKTKCLFTRNRLKDIRDYFNKLSNLGFEVTYRYVKTEDNPADLITRGITLSKLQSVLSFWTEGPVWLHGDVLKWPENELCCLSNESRRLMTNVCTSSDLVPELCPVLDMERFSSLAKLVRVLALVFKFVLNLSSSDKDPVLKARTYLLKLAQCLYLSDERKFLLNPRGSGMPLLVAGLDLFLDEEGLIRSKGRIGNSKFFSDDVLHPVLLPKSCHITGLIIMDCHLQCKHLGIAATLSKLRMSGFWIPKARQAVKTVISSCAVCKRYNSISFRYPRVTNLPKHRVNLVKPFMHTGIDFTGHLWVCEGGETKKMYILIFTCFSVRAVHLELIPDMTTQSVVLALVRFFNIYGVPSHIYSDNALSFVAGCNFVKQVYVSDEFERNFSIHHIKHQTIPLYSAWFGAVWERLIKVVKNCLFKIIGRQKLSYFQLLTVLSDVQSSVNARPLTYRCSDDAGLNIISPNVFIRPYYNSPVFLNLKDSFFSNPPPTKEDLIECLNHRDQFLDDFKKLWYEQYLLGLRELSHDLHQSEFRNLIKVGDVVLIKNPIKPRPYWSLGRVVELTHGNDGLVRSALIKKSDDVTQEHSLKNLYPLELTITHSHQASVPPLETADAVDGSSREPSDFRLNTRPRRKRTALSERDSDFIWY